MCSLDITGYYVDIDLQDEQLYKPLTSKADCANAFWNQTCSRI